jgi:hypothetical protein
MIEPSTKAWWIGMCFGSELTRKGLSFCARAATGNSSRSTSGCHRPPSWQPPSPTPPQSRPSHLFPADVMLDTLFHANLSDFDLARLVDHNGDCTANLLLCYAVVVRVDGLRVYASPAGWRGQPTSHHFKYVGQNAMLGGFAAWNSPAVSCVARATCIPTSVR